MIDVSKQIYRLMWVYASAYTKQIVTVVINQAVDDEVLAKMEQLDLYRITKNKEDEILSVDYNSVAINTFLKWTTSNIQNRLLSLESGDLTVLPNQKNRKNITFSFPLGSIFSFPLIHEFGPEISARLKLINAVMTNVKTTVKEYGINNALIEMHVFVHVEAQIVLPFFASNIVVENEIPISYKVMTGKVPSYFGTSGLEKNSNIFSIPLES